LGGLPGLLAFFINRSIFYTFCLIFPPANWSEPVYSISGFHQAAYSFSHFIRYWKFGFWRKYDKFIPSITPYQV
jgi:hypothetical protein